MRTLSLFVAIAINLLAYISRHKHLRAVKTTVRPRLGTEKRKSKSFIKKSAEKIGKRVLYFYQKKYPFSCIDSVTLKIPFVSSLNT